MATARSGHATWALDVGLVGQNQAGNYSVVQVHFYANADSGWTSGYASGIGFSASNYGNGTYSFGTGGHLEVVTYNVTVGHDANGYASYTASVHSNSTGTTSYGGPVDLSQGISLPRIPKAPSAPGSISVVSNQGLSVALNITGSADNGGSPITAYHVAYSYNGGGWTGDKTDWGTPYTGLAPGNYVFSTYASNAYGNSPRTLTGTVTVVPGAKVWDGSAYKDCLGVFTWNGTAWVPIQGLYTWTASGWQAAL